MNTGTRIRTALAVALALYTAFLKTDVTEFENATVNLIYQICMKMVTFAVIFLITYYNNDYTEEGAVGTQITREMKAMRNCTANQVEEPEDSFVNEYEVYDYGDEICIPEREDDYGEE